MVSIAFAVLAVGTLAGLAIQVYSPNTIPLVSALTNGPITHDELGDGHGNSHYSRVNYSKTTAPWVATVTSVRVGGRHPENQLCPSQQKWKSKHTKYKRWNRWWWSTQKTKSNTPRRTTGTPGLAYFSIGDNVRLEDSAMVENWLNYKITTSSCSGRGGRWITSGFTGGIARKA